MTKRSLWVVAILVAGCSGGSAAKADYPTLASSAQPVAIPHPVMFEGLLLGGVPSADNLKEAKKLGYQTVIDLRAEPGVEEERAVVEALGMTFVNIPVKVPAGLNGDNARAVADALAEKQGFFIVHCRRGERAAAMMALIASCVEGKTAPVRRAGPLRRIVIRSRSGARAR